MSFFQTQRITLTWTAAYEFGRPVIGRIPNYHRNKVWKSDKQGFVMTVVFVSHPQLDTEAILKQPR